MKPYVLLIAFFLSTLAPALWADTDSTEDSIIYGEEFPHYVKLVTSTLSPVVRWSVPYTVTIVSPNSAENIGSRDAADVVEHQAGVEVVRYGGPGTLSNINVRGAQTSQVLLLKDGVPLNDIQSGGMDLTMMSTQMLEQVEIVRGPGASALYGANAMGGVVNYVSAPLSRERIWVKGSGNYGSENTSQVLADLSMPVSKSFAFGGGATMGHSDGFREHSASNTQGQTIAVESGQAEGSFNTALRATHTVSDLEVAGPASLSIDENAQQKDDNWQAAWNGAFQSGGAYVSGVASYRNADLKYTSSDFMTGEPVTDDHKKNEVFGRLIGQNKWGDFKAALGTEYKQDKLNSTSIGKYDSTNIAGITQEEYELKPLLFVAGARYDSNDVWGDVFTPQAATVLHASDDLNLRLAYAQGFRAPTFSELYWPADPIFGGGGNPNLKPEHSWSTELGGDYQIQYLNISTSVFYSRTSDLISGWPPVNIDKVTSYGGELSGKGVIIEKLWLDGYGAFLSAQDEELKQQIDYKPNLSGGGGIAWISRYFGMMDLKARVGYDCVSERWYHRYDPVTFEQVRDSLPAYALVSGQLELSAWKASIWLRGDNLTGEVYQERYDYPMPGRTFSVGVSMEY
jgi:vitamin B12 transporter